ncbi:MAG: hypothetical protein ACI81V_000007 [Lentimonas sp.]|jgi:hypothetical protein
MTERVDLPAGLDAQLTAHFERSRQYFQSLGTACPQALILGGGYGRNEGGVAANAAGAPCFFNDLDYFVFTDRPRDAALLTAVQRWERAESKLLGVDVEAKCLARCDLAQTGESMMFFDLVLGHTVVLGPGDFLQSYRSLAQAESIHAIEATRLLWNRGSGLLFARVDLEAGRDLEVVHRNQSKVKLALGDAWLTVRGLYQSHACERHKVLCEQVDVAARIKELHQCGLAFKLNPTRAPELAELERIQVELVAHWRRCFLEVEAVRLATSFADSAGYVTYPQRLFPARSLWRNLLLSARDRLRRGGALRPLGDYPRGALQRVLLALLEAEPDYLKVSRLLGTPVFSLSAAVAVYRKWWEFYS